MSLEENKKIARRYFEDAPFNPEACDEIFAPVIHFHARPPVTMQPLIPTAYLPQPRKRRPMPG